MRFILTRKRGGEGITYVMSCSKCGYEKPVEKTSLTLVKIVGPSPRESIAIIDREAKELRTLPTVRMECPRCKNNLAYVWQVQTRGSDESSTQFFRCTKCGYTYREYS